MSTHYSQLVNARKTAEAVIKELDESESCQYEEKLKDKNLECNLASGFSPQLLCNILTYYR